MKNSSVTKYFQRNMMICTKGLSSAVQAKCFWGCRSSSLIVSKADYMKLILYWATLLPHHSRVFCVIPDLSGVDCSDMFRSDEMFLLCLLWFYLGSLVCLHCPITCKQMIWTKLAINVNVRVRFCVHVCLWWIGVLFRVNSLPGIQQAPD